MIKLIEKIEGEAKLHFEFKQKKIDFVSIEFLSTRAIEKILEKKNAQDALVLTPRVCGICGHAHLVAAALALESCYDSLELPQKAKTIRELGLFFEIIQNHLKWFYLTLFPLLDLPQEILKASHPAQLMAKAIAVFGGQYPHTSYAIVGGIVSEITPLECMKIQRYLQEVIAFGEKNLFAQDLEKFLEIQKAEELFCLEGDLAKVLHLLEQKELLHSGKSYDKFIAFGANSLFEQGKANKTRVQHKVDSTKVLEEAQQNSFAKNVSYKGEYYEVGPLARAMIAKVPLVKDAHKKYADSIPTRVIARVYELAQLLAHTQKLLASIDFDSPSYRKPKQELATISGEGIGVVEAARGTLIHKVKLHEGIITQYEIITPTQWNLCGGTRQKPGVAQKAMQGLEDIKLAELVFKSFDVCSVCTTH